MTRPVDSELLLPLRLVIGIFLVAGVGCSEAPSTNVDEHGAGHAVHDSIEDPWIERLVSLVGNDTPPDPAPGSFGMDRGSGQFLHPAATPSGH